MNFLEFEFLKIFKWSVNQKWYRGGTSRMFKRKGKTNNMTDFFIHYMFSPQGP